MRLVRRKNELRQAVSALKRDGTLGFVPTMGALHDGHLSLVRRAKDENARVAVSIFVNPVQFGPGEDLANYPRDLEGDMEKLAGLGVDLVFAPADEEMYPEAPVVGVTFSGLEGRLCGAKRKGHFSGVGLVVSKLLNLVQPDVLYLGQKDAQQAMLLRLLVRDMDFDVDVRVCPTVREADGLAMSSRNQYLSDEERKRASVLFRALSAGREYVERSGGFIAPDEVVSVMAGVFDEEPMVDLEYAECVDPWTFLPPEVVDGVVLLAVAAKLGRARLIDNVLAKPGGGSPETLEQLEGWR